MVVRRGYKLTRFRFLRTLRMVNRACPPEHRRVIEFTLNEVRVDFGCGEGTLALELLVSNLHEVSFPVTAELYAELRWLAGRIPMDSAYMKALDALEP